jgi:hypothetical protein
MRNTTDSRESGETACPPTVTDSQAVRAWT